jgi:Skp family chaperone for outer membrane proteins
LNGIIVSLDGGRTGTHSRWDKVDEDATPRTDRENLEAALSYADRVEKQQEIIKAELEIWKDKAKSFEKLNKTLQKTNAQLNAETSGGNDSTAPNQTQYVHRHFFLRQKE